MTDISLDQASFLIYNIQIVELEINNQPKVTGVSFVCDELQTSMVFLINDLCDGFKHLIRENLHKMSYGAEKVTKWPGNYTYKKTLKEFFIRYDKKTEDQRKGLIGELLTTILLLHYKDTFFQASPSFNSEERNLKKGFDIVLFEKTLNEIWFTEVKSGHPQDLTSAEKTKKLVHTAKSHLAGKLNEQDRAVWDNAVSGASLVLLSQKKDAILDFLNDCLSVAESEGQQALDHNAILASVLFKNVSEPIVLNFVQELQKEICESAHFKKVIVCCTQKSTVEKVVDFLKSEIHA